jgi:hypothetical protein
MVGDPKKAQEFYGAIFNWQFDPEAMPGYTLVNAGAEPTGAMFKKPDHTPGVCANIYFQVPDIDTTLRKVGEGGGFVLVPKTEIPNVGHFAMFADPEGISIGLMQPSS